MSFSESGGGWAKWLPKVEELKPSNRKETQGRTQETALTADDSQASRVFLSAKKTQLTALTADDSQNCQKEAENDRESPEMPCHPAGDEPALWGGVHPTYSMFETFFGESGDISHHVC